MSITTTAGNVCICAALFCAAFLAAPHIASAYGYGEGYYYGQAYYYGQGYYYSQANYHPVFTDTVGIIGNLTIAGRIAKGSGTFLIDHPLDIKNKLLYHSFVESPDVKNLYDGIVTLDGNGEVVVRLPGYFEALNKDFRYQLKPIGASMPDLYVKEEEKGNRFVIGGGKAGGRVSWQITGTRHDAYIEANPILVEEDKGPDAPVDKGEYLFEGYKATFSMTNLFSGFEDIFYRLSGQR